MSEEDHWLEQARRGDADALGRLLERHAPSLRGWLRREIPARWRSLIGEDDVLQETFTDAFIDLETFVPRSTGSLERWLNTLARNNLRNAVRLLERDKRGGRRHRLESGPSDESQVQLLNLLSGNGTTPSRAVSRAESVWLVDRMLSTLPEEYRRVVQLYDLEGVGSQEIGRLLGRSPGAVAMLRARAHRLLRRRLGNPGAFFTDSA
jgi:RNA polymerase sigma-70 factor (ECF subfamily)